MTKDLKPDGSRDPIRTQFGELTTTEPTVKAYREAQYGYLPYWELFSQADGTEAPLEDIEEVSGETKFTMPSGKAGTEIRRLQVREKLQYISSRVAFWSGYCRIEDDDFQGTQTLEVGPSTSKTGFLFQLEAGSDEIDCIIRKEGTDRVINDIPDKNSLWRNRKKMPASVLYDGAILGVIFAWYGKGPFVSYFALQPGKVIPYPDNVREYYQIYSPQDDEDLIGPLVETPNLPIRYEIQNNGTTPSEDASVYVGGAQIGLFGKEDPHSRAPMELYTDVDVSESLGCIFVIRPKTQFAGRENDTNIVVDTVQIVNTGGNDMFYRCQIDGDSSAVDQWDDSIYEQAPDKYASPAEMAVGDNAQGTFATGAPVRPADYLQTGQGNASGAGDEEEVDFVLGGEGETFSIFAQGNTTVQLIVGYSVSV